MQTQRKLFRELVGWGTGCAWLAGFMAGTWLDRSSNYLQLFGVVQLTLFSILAARSLLRQTPQGTLSDPMVAMFHWPNQLV